MRALGKHPKPCPECQNPIRESMWQVLFVVACGLPLAAGTLYASKMAFDTGSTTLTIVVLIAGVVLSTCVLYFAPTIHGPAKTPK